MMERKSTFVLIGINVIVFAWLAIQQESLLMDKPSDVIAILNAGGNLNPFTLNGEAWRIITSMFLHYGAIHLIVNMYGLYSLGGSLEPAIGTPRFLLVYFICGLGAGMASLLFNVFVISAGASGAIFGLFGYSLTSEVISSLKDRQKLTSILINFLIFVVVNAVISSQVSVDMSGHIGGLVTGAVLSLLNFKFNLLVETKWLLVTLILLPFLLIFFPTDQVRYYQLFHRLVETERRENKFMRSVQDDDPLKDSLKVVANSWDSLQRATRSMSFVRPELATDTNAFKQYLAVRREQTGFRIKLIEKESYIYYDSLEITGQKLDSVAPFSIVPIFEIHEEVQQDTTEAPGPRYETVRVFYDSTWKEIHDPTAAIYFRVGARDSLGRWQGSIRDYYRDGKVQMKGGYHDNLRDGVFIYYSDRNTYESAGRYNKGRAVGKWERFHWNGVLREEVYYNDGGFIKNTWDSLGRPQVVNGFGKSISWHDNGVIAEEGNVTSGKREGYWHGFNRDGSPYYEDLYRDNRLIRGVAVTKDGKRYVYDELSEFPMPEGGMQAFYKYQIRNMMKDPSWGGGSVKVIFDVAVDGSLSDFTILESSCPECNAEAIRLVKEGPRWRCGVLHGHVKIPGQGYVEIEF